MDAYDEMVAYLTERPGEIVTAWRVWLEHPCAPLFEPVVHPESPFERAKNCGCLTEIRSGLRAQTDDLTAAIRADIRIPLSPKEITPDHLPIFAGWQRRIDAALGRT